MAVALRNFCYDHVRTRFFATSRGESVPIRLDMPRPRAEGFKAFMDGEEKMSCPYKRPDPKNSQWHAGYEEAREEKAKRDAETYR